MKLSELSSALDAIGAATYSEDEVLAHFKEKYQQVPYDNREVFLFTNQREFGEGKHIVSFHLGGSPKIPEHIYQYVVVTYCYKGVFPLVIDGSPVTLDSGDCVVMDRNVPHKVEATDPDTLAVNIVLSNRFFERRMMSDIARLHTRFATELATAGAPHRRFGIYRTHGDEFARDCVDRILCEHLDYTVGSADIIDDFVAALLTYLFRTFESDSEAFEQDERRSELVGVMREYIAQHYAEGSLKKMAQDLGYDSTYLSSLIRQGTGCSFKQLVNEERMQHATVLLQMTSMPANEVAGAVGISNLTQFYKRFREFAGCTPKEFREKASYGRA